VKPFKFGDLTLRAFEHRGEPWFVAADACRVLGLAPHKGSFGHHLARFDAAEVAPMKNLGVRIGKGMAASRAVSEGALYKLVMRSHSPAAKPFQDWVTRTVLPAIRKDGAYIKGEEKVASGELSEDEFILRAVEILRGKVDRLAAERDALAAAVVTEKAEKVLLIEDRSKLSAEVLAAAPKVAVHDAMISSGSLLGLRETAKALGLHERAFITRCIERKILYRVGESKVPVPHQRYIDNGICQVRWEEHGGKMRPKAFFTAKGVGKLAQKVVMAAH
jgi:prophage antirepressor-like protein